MKTSSQLFATDRLDELITWLVPAVAGFHFHQLIMAADKLTLVLRSSPSVVHCPLCGQETSRVHSRYHRTLQDLPWGQLRVQLRLQVHRFFCQNPYCARKIFTEPLPDLAERSARCTNRLREALLVMGWALGGEAGARQCAAHAMPISGTTLLTLLRRYGVAAEPTPRILGVDDWSFQARTTGTLLVDLERHRPVEVLLGSDEQVLAEWLLTHPGVEVICRDRGASYLKGASKGAPNATQVLDRWHLLKNLGDVLQKILAQQIAVLQQAAQEAVSREPSQQAPLVALPPPTSRNDGTPEESAGPTQQALPPAVRARKPPRRVPAPPRKQRLWQLQMYAEVRRLSTQGWSQRAIADTLHLHHNTVRKYQRMEQFTDQRHNPHGSIVEPYRAYLQERWSQGCTMVKTLWEELRAQGFTGGYKSVCLFTRKWCVPQVNSPTSAPPKPTGQQPRTPWQAKWLLLSAPEELSASDACYRQAICQRSTALAQAASLARDFVQMVRERTPEHLDRWLEQARASPLQELRRFALGLDKEDEAVRASLREPWSTGQVEGQITRLKYLKRQMYGRAKIDLLRLRVLQHA
jgi:transposase